MFAVKYTLYHVLLVTEVSRVCARDYHFCTMYVGTIDILCIGLFRLNFYPLSYYLKLDIRVMKNHDFCRDSAPLQSCSALHLAYCSI